MKKHILLFFLLALASFPSFAHFMWVETNPEAILNQQHEIKVRFGEYTYGAIEKVNGDAFSKMKHFKLWVIDNNGNKTQLKTITKNDHYVAYYTPQNNGTYTVVLNNNNVDVIDYTEYDFGIFKTHYHATAAFTVGNKTATTKSDNATGLSVVQLASNTKNETILQVNYKGKPLAKNEVNIYITDQWSKTLYTNESGVIRFKLPWQSPYVIETTLKEGTPGKFKGKDYQFIWHCASYYLLNQ